MKLVRRKQVGNITGEDKQASLLDRVYSMRGVNSHGELVMQLKNLHPISQLKGVEQATELLSNAINNQQRILIVGDFDADGATSTALAVRALNMMGHKQVDYLVPNRFEYGYGLTPEIVDEAANFTPDLIITVDNGISSIKGVAHAKTHGYTVIITDHHLPAKTLPEADAIVNPNQVGCNFPSKNLAGVGVIFYVMLSLKSALLKEQYFKSNNIPEPNLTELLDLVALGTVADVVPLDNNNRILVEQGLRRLRSGLACAGIVALFQVAKRNSQNAVSADLGFTCGPRLNAAGRLDDMSLGIECLLCNDPQIAMDYASALDDLNIERRAIEESMKAEALVLLEALDNNKLKGDLPPVICLYQKTWHQGVIGILAARVRERYHRPTVIFAPADVDDPKNSQIKGSARSIPSIHIRDVFDEVATANEGLLDKFGGHAMAAGLSLDESQLEAFNNAICKVVSAQADDETFQEIHYSDGQLEADDFNLKSADSLRFAAPWGQNFPAPVFDNQFVLINKRLLKERHLKLILRPCYQQRNSKVSQSTQRTIQAIAFNVDVGEWPEEGADVHLLYKLEVNEFRGDCSVQLMIERVITS